MPTSNAYEEEDDEYSPSVEKMHRQHRQHSQHENHQKTRITVPLEKGRPIGLELDFSVEAKGGEGVRVSRVDAGLAQRLGLQEEDRLVAIGDEDVCGIDYGQVRQMLQQPCYPTRLIFEGSWSRDNSRSRSSCSSVLLARNVRLESPPGFSHGLLHQQTMAKTGSVTAKPPSRKRHREGKQHAPPPRLPPVAAAAATPPAVAAQPFHGDLVEQLDFLAAQQQAEEEAAAAVAAEAAAAGGAAVGPARSERRPSPHTFRASRGGGGGEGGGSPSSSLVGRGFTPPRRSTPAMGATAASSAAAAVVAESSQTHRRRQNRTHEHRPREQYHRQEQQLQHQQQYHKQKQQQKQQQQQQVQAGGREEEDPDVVVIDNPGSLPPPPPPPPPRRSHHQHAGRTTPSAPLPPPWLRILFGLALPEVAGTRAAKAAVISKEVNDMLTKELKALKRLRKVAPSVTLAEYSAFRGPSLRSSPDYRNLKSFEEQYLKGHEDELVKIAEISVLPDLLGDESNKASASPHRRATPTSAEGADDTEGAEEGRNHHIIVRRPSAGARNMVAEKAAWQATTKRITFVQESHSAVQSIIRRALASHERAVATADAHRRIRRQSLLDVKEARAGGKKTEHQATVVIAKIRGWEKAARVSEKIAVGVSGAVTGRVERLRDAVELLMAGLETQKARVESLAMV